MSQQPSIRIIPGRVSDTTAQLYVQAEVSEAAEPCYFSGSIDGPHLHNAHTLPAKIRFRDLGPGDSILAETIIPDPCVWTPDCPALYDLSLDMVAASGQVVNQFQQKTGIPSFGVYNNSFYLNSKRFVPRLIHEALLGGHSLQELHDARLGLCVTAPTDDLLYESSRLGVPLLVQSSGERLDELAVWPAVCGILVNTPTSLSPTRLTVVGAWPDANPDPNPGATSQSSGDVGENGIEAWTVAEEDASDMPGELMAAPIVFTATLSETEEHGLDQLRARCDQLQQQTVQATRGAGFLLLPASIGE